MITSHIDNFPDYFKSKLGNTSNTDVAVRFWPKEQIQLHPPNPNMNFSKVLNLKYSDLGPEGIKYPTRPLIIRCSDCENFVQKEAPNEFVFRVRSCKNCYKATGPKQSAMIEYDLGPNKYWT